jgi:hypothetical protein
MLGVIINKDDVLDCQLFLEKIKPTAEQNLIFIVVKDELFYELDKKNPKRKIPFFNSPTFVNQIQYSLCGKFDKNEKTVYITNCDPQWVGLLIETFHKYFEEDVKIVMPLTETTSTFGFSFPHSCAWNEKELCGIRPNRFLTNSEIQNNYMEIEYLKRQLGDFCSISLDIDKDTIDFLKHLTIAGVTQNKSGDRSQKEVFGSFLILKSTMKGNDIVHTLGINEKSLVYGTEDQITAPGGLYTFHSHPFNAYLKYKTDNGYPSATDYWAVYNLCRFHRAIVHFIASLEGLYVLSCKPESEIFQGWDKKKVKTFIWDKLDIHKNGHELSLKKYITFVNKLNLFTLHLLPWNQIQNHNIKISFSKVGKSCLIR